MSSANLEELQQWAQENLSRGCSLESLIKGMRDSGYDEHTVRITIRRAQPSCGPGIQGASTETAIETPDRRVPVASQLADPEIVVLRDFLSADECAELIELARTRLARSTTVSRETGRKRRGSASAALWHGRGIPPSLRLFRSCATQLPRPPRSRRPAAGHPAHVSANTGSRRAHRVSASGHDRCPNRRPRYLFHLQHRRCAGRTLRARQLSGDAR